MCSVGLAPRGRHSCEGHLSELMLAPAHCPRGTHLSKYTVLYTRAVLQRCGKGDDGGTVDEAGVALVCELLHGVPERRTHSVVIA